MKKQKLQQPKARFNSEPFINGFTDIDKENSDFIIGNSERFENIFENDKNFPEYLKLLCKISAKSEFQDVSISAKYKTENDENEPENTMTYNLYDGSKINMKGLVSEININICDIVPDFGIVETEEIKEFVNSNPLIYTKKFETQKKSNEIENFRDYDSVYDESSLIHTKTRAHFFAGSFQKTMKISDIQQYFFFMGTGYQGEEFINLISAKDLIQTQKVKPTTGIKLENLSTLEDDIMSGKIEINFDDKNVKYQSMSSIKTTLTSEIFQIIFKKI